MGLQEVYANLSPDARAALKLGLVGALGGGAVGGLTASSGNRLRNALIGAGVGGAASAGLSVPLKGVYEKMQAKDNKDLTTVGAGTAAAAAGALGLSKAKSRVGKGLSGLLALAGLGGVGKGVSDAAAPLGGVDEAVDFGAESTAIQVLAAQAQHQWENGDYGQGALSAAYVAPAALAIAAKHPKAVLNTAKREGLNWLYQ